MSESVAYMKVPQLVSVSHSTSHTESTGSHLTVAGNRKMCVYGLQNTKHS